MDPIHLKTELIVEDNEEGDELSADLQQIWSYEADNTMYIQTTRDLKENLRFDLENSNSSGADNYCENRSICMFTDEDSKTANKQEIESYPEAETQVHNYETKLKPESSYLPTENSYKVVKFECDYPDSFLSNSTLINYNDKPEEMEPCQTEMNYTELPGYNHFKIDTVKPYVKAIERCEKPKIEKSIKEEPKISTPCIKTEVCESSNSELQEDVSAEIDFEEKIKICFTTTILGSNVEQELEIPIVVNDNTGPDNNTSDQPNPYACPKCDFKTNTHSSLKRHVSTHEKEKPSRFFCNLCDYVTSYKYSLTRHQRVHGEGKKDFTCKLCDKKFNSKRYFDLHLIKKHQNESDYLQESLTNSVIKCNFCDYQTVFRKIMCKHMDANHAGKEFRCKFCQYTTTLESDLTIHLSIHSDVAQFPCGGCDRSFNERRLLDSHIVSRHNNNEDLVRTISEKIFQCSACSYRCMNTGNLSRHMRNVHKKD